MTRRLTPAAEQFHQMGLTPADYTPAMEIAVKQKWGDLPVDDKVADLRDRIDAVTTEPTPTAIELEHAGLDAEAAATEAKRLKRNAKVQAWRERNHLQAALDARELKFARMRAAKVSVGA